MKALRKKGIRASSKTPAGAGLIPCFLNQGHSREAILHCSKQHTATLLPRLFFTAFWSRCEADRGISEFFEMIAGLAAVFRFQSLRQLKALISDACANVE